MQTYTLYSDARHPHGWFDSSQLQGGFESRSGFEGFLTSLPFDSGTVLVLDNSSLHKTKQVRAIAETKGVKLLYTPPYTPEYNPIELLFGSVKCAFYKTRYSSHFGDDVKECARICVDRMTTTE